MRIKDFYNENGSLNKECALKALKHIKNKEDDIEHRHTLADVVLLEFIDDEDIQKAYDEIQPKWYA